MRTALLRWIDDGHLGAAYGVHVLEETDERVAVWQPTGTLGRKPGGIRSGPRSRNLLASDWDGGYVDHRWDGDGVLRVHVPGQRWSTWRWMTSRGWSPSWYVNLERPWRRTPLGFESTDWILDLLIDADGAVQVKDADEFEWAREVGRLTEQQLTDAAQAADEARAAIEARAFPFGADWSRWSDLPAEPVPLPDGWDRIPV